MWGGDQELENNKTKYNRNSEPHHPIPKQQGWPATNSEVYGIHRNRPIMARRLMEKCVEAWMGREQIRGFTSQTVSYDQKKNSQKFCGGPTPEGKSRQQLRQGVF